LTCRLCLENKALIEAHIIPRCLYAPLKHASGPMMRISRDPGVPPRASHTGEYDTDILCTDCDNLFSPWDSYACDILLQQLPEQRIKVGPTGQRFYVVGDYDYTRLKLFVLSVLWRMSVSTRPAFRNVKLGPFEGQLRKRLLDKDPGTAKDFPVFIYRYLDDVGAFTILETRPERLLAMRVYNVGLPGYIGVVKVDRQPLPIAIGPLVLKPNGPLFIGLRDMQREPEWRLVQQIFGNQQPRSSAKRTKKP